MGDFISREAVDAAIKAAADHRKAVGVPGEQAGFLQAHDIVRSLPAADVAPVRHGRWLPSNIPDSILDKCSECGFDTGSFTFNYCPNCGAMMNGGQSRLVSVTTRQPDEWKSVLTCVTRKCVPLPEPPKLEASLAHCPTFIPAEEGK